MSSISRTLDTNKVRTSYELKNATVADTSAPEFFRHLGFFENWAATYIAMNFVSGMPVMFGFAMYTGGPKAAFANWTMVGGHVNSERTSLTFRLRITYR